MKRRTIIQSFGLATTHALFPSILTGFLAGCANDSDSNKEKYEPIFFNQNEFGALEEIIDLIIPATKSASASATHCHHFIDEVFAKCLTAEQQSKIKKGLSTFLPQFNSSKNKFDLLNDLDQKAYSGDEASAWFIPLKQYAMVGFFTSQEGETRASNYIPAPGDYQGNISLDESTLNYGTTSLRYYI